MKTTKVITYEFGNGSMVRVDRISRMFVREDGCLYFYCLGSKKKHTSGNIDGDPMVHYNSIMRLLK